MYFLNSDTNMKSIADTIEKKKKNDNKSTIFSILDTGKLTYSAE